MDVTSIYDDNLQYFRDLMLPNVYQALERGMPVSAVGLVDEETACGAVAGYIDGNAFQVASLFVAPQFRRKGGATLLLDTMKKLLLDINGVYTMRIEYTISRDDHLTLRPFLDKYGFLEETEDTGIYGVTLEQVKKTPFFAQSDAHQANKATPFSQIPPIYIKMLDRSISSTGIRPYGDPLDRANYDAEISMGAVSNNKIEAFVLFDHSFDGKLTLAYAYSEAGGVSGPATLISLLRSAFSVAVRKYPPDTQIIINAANPTSAALLKKITGRDNLQTLSYTGTLSLNQD